MWKVDGPFPGHKPPAVFRQELCSKVTLPTFILKLIPLKCYEILNPVMGWGHSAPMHLKLRTKYIYVGVWITRLVGLCLGCLGRVTFQTCF